MSDPLSSFQALLVEHRAALRALEAQQEPLEHAVMALSKTFGRLGRVFVCGNGGSFAHAQHLAAELVVRFCKPRRALAAIALGSNGAVVSATCNDLHPEDLFARELRALGCPQDALVAISTSGRSHNVREACAVAQAHGMALVTITGSAGMLDLAYPPDAEVRVRSDCTAVVQQIHTVILHAICAALEHEAAVDCAASLLSAPGRADR